MISYEDLNYLVAFANLGTLSQVAEELHTSQPTVTRCMKRLEEEFDTPLFDRSKNSIKLSETGKLAAREAAAVIKQTGDMLGRVRAHHRASHTISVGSAAVVQIPNLIGRISALHPEMTISSELKKPQELERGFENNIYQLIILPYKPQTSSLVSAEIISEEIISAEIGQENLMFFLPKNHRFAKRKSLTLGEMNGENMLILSKIGFWYDLVKEKMPDSRFLVQTERYSLDELIMNSVLPCFITNLSGGDKVVNEKRVCVPITDPEVNVTYYLVCKKESRKRFSALF